MDLPLFGPHGFAHGGKVYIALCPGKFLVQLRGGLFSHGVQLDLKLCGLAGEFLHPELLRVSEIKAEGLTSGVAVDGIFGGRHQLAVPQNHHHLFHPAVGDLLPIHEADKIQQDPAAALGGGGGVVVNGVHPGLVDHLLVNGLFGKRPHMAGDSQPLVLT